MALICTNELLINILKLIYILTFINVLIYMDWSALFWTVIL